MLKNYFKIAWRNISGHKVNSFINVLGLALGISACIVIYLVTSYDLSFDTFHPDRDRIYRITGEMKQPNGEMDFLNSVMPDVAGFENDIPGFETKAGVHFYDGQVTIPDSGNQGKKFENKIPGTYSPAAIITTSQYFTIFKYVWLKGIR